MAIQGLERVITGQLLSRLSRVAGTSSAAGAKGITTKNGEPTGQALYDSLRVGARNFAAGAQLLNGAISFVNVSLDANEKLMALVDKAIALTKKVNKGNVTASDAKNHRRDFDSLATKFDDIIEQTSSGAKDILGVKDLQAVLEKAGLFRKDVREVDSALAKIAPANESSISVTGEVTSGEHPIPLDAFHQSLRRAVVDGDDPAVDNSGLFRKVEQELNRLRQKLSGNVKALTQTSDLLRENLTVARAAGFAFLDLSNSISGRESAEAVAQELQARIRSGAPTALSQAHNLERILVAGLAALSEATK